MSGISLKLASVLIRQVAKPISTVIKNQAKQHPRFKHSCIRVAQLMHRTDVNLRMKLLGEQASKIRPLNDARAVENGANFLSEAFIFSVAGSLILFESYRSRKKETKRRETVADDIRVLQLELEYLKGTFSDDLRALRNEVKSLQPETKDKKGQLFGRG